MRTAPLLPAQSHPSRTLSSQDPEPSLEAVGSAADGAFEFDTWAETFAAAKPGDTLRVDKLVVWSINVVHWVQVFGRIFSSEGGRTEVKSAAEPPAALGAIAGGPPPKRCEVVLSDNEYIQCCIVWSGFHPPRVKDPLARRSDYIGSMTVTLSMCRVFRFGSSWFPERQYSPCSPEFDKTIPAGAHVLGLRGLRRSAGGLIRVGVAFADAAAVAEAPRPYQARLIREASRRIPDSPAPAHLPDAACRPFALAGEL